jgi:MFS family permease
MELDKKRWLILAAFCAINLAVGSLYAWSVFAGPLAVHLSAVKGVSFTAGDLSAAFTAANFTAPVSLISGGSVNDRLGPKWVVFTGGLLFGVALALTGVAGSIGMMMLTYGIIGGMGMGFAYGSVVSSSVKFFPDKRGLIGGMTMAAYGLSSVIVPLIANALIDGMGIMRAMLAIGAGTAAVVCFCAMFLQKCPPGYKPKGWNPSSFQQVSFSSDRNWRFMLSSPSFYIMIGIITCGGFYGLMIISQTSTIAQKMIGMNVGMATGAVSLLALFNAFGRILCGYISDRIGRINCLIGTLSLAVIAMLTLYLCKEGDSGMFIASICIVGFCFGALMGIFPGFTADVFGSKHNSVNYGVMLIGFSAAGVAGPMIMNRIANSGHYQPAFLLAAGIAAVGVLLCILYRPLTERALKNVSAL